MATADELTVAAELVPLQEIAALLGWHVDMIDGTTFVLGLPAKDGSMYWSKVVCERYPAYPPAWHWYNPASKAIDLDVDTPRGGNFLHSAGVICAPWNRLAYKEIDSRGPHGDWSIGNWRTNEKTLACRTLSAMALRVALELKTHIERKRAA